MKIITSVILLTVLFINYTAAKTPVEFGKADFNGIWVLDKEKTVGLPPEMSQVMKVKQDGDILEIETKILMNKNEQVVPDKYSLNGKEEDLKLPNGKGKRISKWNAEGNGIEVNDKVNIETPDGKMDIESTRKWTLSADGKTLVIEILVKGPKGTQELKRTFTK